MNLNPLSVPGAGHRVLEPLIGLWDTATLVFDTSVNRPVEADGSVEKTWAMGGRFVQEDLAGVTADEVPYLGLGFLGYDNSSGRYQGAWMSSGATGLTLFEGHADPTGRVITCEGTEPNLEGGPPCRFRSVLVIEADQHVLTHYRLVGHEAQRLFEIIHTRVD